jgi:hypothetical protein
MVRYFAGFLLRVRAASGLLVGKLLTLALISYTPKLLIRPDDCGMGLDALGKGNAHDRGFDDDDAASRRAGREHPLTNDVRGG